VVVEGPLPEFGLHHLGLGPRLRLELLGIDGEGVPNRSRELLGHSRPWAGEGFQSRAFVGRDDTADRPESADSCPASR